jgi:DNA transformation protein
MNTLTDLPNVGKVLESNLKEAGICTPEKLREIGAKEAFLRIRMIDPTACIHMLYGIEGAVEGIRDNFLSDSTKKELREFYRSL